MPVTLAGADSSWQVVDERRRAKITAAASTTPSGSELSAKSELEHVHAPGHAHGGQEPEEHGDAAERRRRLGVDAPLVGLHDPAEPQAEGPHHRRGHEGDGAGDPTDDGVARDVGHAGRLVRRRRPRRG